MTDVRARASAIGSRTLAAFADTTALNRWIYSKLSGGVHGDVLEIGSGIGNMSRLIRERASHLVVTDAEPGYLGALGDVFARDGAVEVVAYDLDHAPPARVADRAYDAIVAVNVIEHIADDKMLVSRLSAMLRPRGRLLVYVPACPSAYGSLDVALGHYRRYTPETLSALLRGADLEPGRPRYMNLLGLAGWMVSGRLLGADALSPRAAALFERLIPLIRLEDTITLPWGLGLWTHATKPA
jgi:SAM-dependent methyltransferase